MGKFIHQLTTTGPDLYQEIPSRTWRLEFDRPDALRHLYVFPRSTFEWRIAEYGFDRDDVDGILDVILHEQFVDMGDEYLFDLPTLVTARHQQEAREAHLERIRLTKLHKHIVVPHDDKYRPHPHDIIRKDHGITTAGIAEKKWKLIPVLPHRDKVKYVPRYEERLRLKKLAMLEVANG